ncbi:FG-GAP repeat domain-containing protein [Solirubrum puertoriconensis]|uniref:VCBS repeat-containing protein n=1 Tax=Solirubrum puertoriconensis TaxID=1751427 RepID=A0A9X0HJ94_SOLP1|nr:VCBS repeat-containing protein [Solirubrum puertoriconensis]KUG06940.1 hypothetical protein ASU33_06345 [Solirubrum puertoriconensis]
MRYRYSLVLVTALTTTSSAVQSAPYALPAWAETQWQAARLSQTYSRVPYLKPQALHADFNGDGKLDVAVAVIRKQSGSHGMLILHQGQTGVHVIGTGSAFSNDMLHTNFQWADHWQLYIKPSTFEGYLVKMVRFPATVPFSCSALRLRFGRMRPVGA